MARKGLEQDAVQRMQVLDGRASSVLSLLHHDHVATLAQPVASG